jgi:hypothetical protein
MIDFCPYLAPAAVTLSIVFLGSSFVATRMIIADIAPGLLAFLRRPVAGRGSVAGLFHRLGLRRRRYRARQQPPGDRRGSGAISLIRGSPCGVCGAGLTFFGKGLRFFLVLDRPELRGFRHVT